MHHPEGDPIRSLALCVLEAKQVSLGIGTTKCRCVNSRVRFESMTGRAVTKLSP